MCTAAVLAAFAAGLTLGLMHRVVPPPPPPAPTCAQVEASQTTETCMAWWFGSKPTELAQARKRICGRK